MHSVTQSLSDARSQRPDSVPRGYSTFPHYNTPRLKIREIKTSADIRDWNAGKIPVAVIHPASAGHGLNLQAGGSTLIWFGLTWSLELYQQTNARLWRQGQSETVVIHHIITNGTVDNHVLKALQSKEKTQNSLIAAVKAELYK